MSLDIRRLAHDERVQSLARYLVVGLVSYGIDVGLLLLCWHVLHAPLWLATSMGFWGSFGVNFVLSRHWTFDVGNHPVGAQLVRYGILVAVNYVVTVLAVLGLHHAGLPVVAARTLTLAVLTISTFILYRTWVFARKDGIDASRAGGP